MAELIKGQGLLKPGPSVVCERAAGAEGVCVLLSDQPIRGGIQNQWIVEISAKLEDGFATVGRVITQRPQETVEPRSRVVAVANMPGATGWRASFRGETGQTAWITLVAGNGVGAGLPGVWASRPRPRDYARAASRLVTTFDTILMGAFVADTSDPAVPIPASGLWLQFFNARTAPANGDIPIFEQKIQPNANVQVSFDQGAESGDARFSLGLGWALSSTPGVLTLATPVISVQTVLG